MTAPTDMNIALFSYQYIRQPRLLKRCASVAAEAEIIHLVLYIYGLRSRDPGFNSRQGQVFSPQREDRTASVA
jgi:hypothetical protein